MGPGVFPACWEKAAGPRGRRPGHPREHRGGRTGSWLPAVRGGGSKWVLGPHVETRMPEGVRGPSLMGGVSHSSHEPGTGTPRVRHREHGPSARPQIISFNKPSVSDPWEGSQKRWIIELYYLLAFEPSVSPVIRVSLIPLITRASLCSMPNTNGCRCANR